MCIAVVRKCETFPGTGVGHLFLHLFNCVELSSVSLLVGAVVGLAMVIVLTWYGVGLLCLLVSLLYDLLLLLDLLEDLLLCLDLWGSL